MTRNWRIILTGGPGSGKSTLITALAAAGFATEPEAGRTIIQEQMATGGSALPWADRARFAEKMAVADIAAHSRRAEASGPVFFDRGLPDVVGYLRLCDLPIPPCLEADVKVRRYAEPVFIAPFWPEIFIQDAERRQDAAEALRTVDMMTAVYAAEGYALIELPRASVETRMAFIIDRVM